MINKQNLWFVTLFSLILVLGIYYVTMGDETLSVLAGENNVSSPVEVKASDVIVALQVCIWWKCIKRKWMSIKVFYLMILPQLKKKMMLTMPFKRLSNSKSECEKSKNELQKILNSRFVSYVFRRAGERHNCYPPDVWDARRKSDHLWYPSFGMADEFAGKWHAADRLWDRDSGCMGRKSSLEQRQSKIRSKPVGFLCGCGLGEGQALYLACPCLGWGWYAFGMECPLWFQYPDFRAASRSDGLGLLPVRMPAYPKVGNIMAVNWKSLRQRPPGMLWILWQRKVFICAVSSMWQRKWKTPRRMYVAWAFMNFRWMEKKWETANLPLFGATMTKVSIIILMMSPRKWRKAVTPSESCWEMDFTMCKAAAIVNCKSVSALPRFVSEWWWIMKTEPVKRLFPERTGSTISVPYCSIASMAEKIMTPAVSRKAGTCSV